MQIFEEVLFSKLRTTEKHKYKQSLQHILCQLDARRQAEEKTTTKNKNKTHKQKKLSLFYTNYTQAKRSKTHRRLKERFLIGRNRTKRANFRGSPLFQATYNIKTDRKKKQTINSICLVSVRCSEAGGRKRARD